MGNTFLLAGNKFLLKMHLRQPGFTYNAYGLLTKNKERIQKFNETGGSRYIYQNELDKACFQHDMAYWKFIDLPRRTASDKILRDKQLILLKIRNMMDIKEVLHQWFTKVLIRSLFCLHGQRLYLHEINLLPVVVLKVKLCQTEN